MNGYSPKLPLTRDSVDGFRLTKNLKEMVQQNFKNLVLTAPGERVMDSNFGVGLRNYLFEQISETLFTKISARIRTQVKRYLSFVTVEFITFDSMDTNPELGPNEIQVTIRYNILPLDAEDTLSITAQTN